MRDVSVHDEHDEGSREVGGARVDGRAYALDGVPPHRTLLHWLRGRGFTGTKEGCAEGDCGACTVALRERGPDGPGPWTAVNSCLLPALACDGREIRTVEGLASSDGTLHAVQQALVDSGGSQCGYCTPGFVMSLWVAHETGALTARGAASGGASAEPASDSAPDSAIDSAIDAAIEGNLCRCTGYLPIRRAARAVVDASAGARTEDTGPSHDATDGPTAARGSSESEHGADAEGGARPHALPRPTDVVVGDARFVRPASLADALALLAEEGAIAVAGGTDLGVEVAKHGRRPGLWVSLEAVPELRGTRVDGREVRVGAADPLSEVERTLAGVSPALDTMLRWFAARQIRNRATLGGNLGTASPIGDLAPVLLALDAELDLVRRGDGSSIDRRALPIADAFLGYRETAWGPHELIEAARWRRGPSDGASRRLEHSAKVGKRGTDDISIVAAAYVIDLGPKDEIVHARLAYGGVAATPVRARDVEAWLAGRPWTAATVHGAATRLEAAFEPLDDLRGSAAYRRKLAGNLFRRFAAASTGTVAPPSPTPPIPPAVAPQRVQP